MGNTAKNVVMCNNPEKGHFFDANCYDNCPLCGCPRKSEDFEPEVNVKSKKNKTMLGLFYKKNRDQNGNPRTMKVSTEPEAEKNIPIFTPTLKLQTEDKSAEETDELKNNQPDDYLVSDMSDSGENNNQSEPVVTEESGSEKIPVDKDIADEGISEADETEKINSTPSVPHNAPAESGGGLAAAIKKVSANSEGKTMSYFDSAKKTSAKEENRHIDPVAGWLVCIAGAHFGASFNIAAGMNSIGRSDSNRIVLDMDNSVSRDKHAFVTYEPRKRRFFVKPGDSSGLTYVNDEYITESIEIKSMDVIELGNSKFILVPLCGENFTWEDYISKE